MRGPVAVLMFGLAAVALDDKAPSAAPAAPLSDRCEIERDWPTREDLGQPRRAPRTRDWNPVYRVCGPAEPFGAGEGRPCVCRRPAAL